MSDDDDDDQFEDFLLQCSHCDEIFRGPLQFNAHHRNVRNIPLPLVCGHNGCDHSFEHRTSLLRHIKTDHFERNDHLQLEDPEGNIEENVQENNPPDHNIEDNDNSDDNDVDQHQLSNDSIEAEEELDLKKSAAKMILDLRQTGGITNALVNRCQDACYDLVQDVSKSLQLKVKKFLEDEGIAELASSKALLREFKISDPFIGLKTLKQQLQYYASEMGLVVPVTVFLGYRMDYRLDPDTNEYLPSQVSMTFEYIPIIESFKLILKNPKLKHLIETEKFTEDGVLRSYVDGNRAKSNAIIRRHPHVIRIQLYVDDVETASALGSRTIIHKLLAVYFSIQNLPPEESSQLSSIFLLVLAYSEDIKNMPDGYATILYPFLQDLKKLESPEGVEIRIDYEVFILRATLVILCADTLAAHDILGFLSPSARHFCRMCMVSRPQFHANCKAMGEQRTKQTFNNHVALVKARPAASTECGVARECPLHKAAHFSATDDAPFDIFHDILEGVAHIVILLALRSFITRKHLFTVAEFNSRIASFSYGIPDIKNKPSANFTQKRLFSHHFLQKGSQTWCLTRIFGFLVADVPSDDSYLKLVNLLQKCMLIIFAPEIREEDIARLEVLTDEFLGLFQQLHMDPIEILDIEEEEEAGAAGQAIQREVTVAPINKLHHMSHYPKMIQEMGPPIKYWCMRYEARHHIFVKYAADMCNFINVPKSMAQMHQLCTLSGVLKQTLRKDDLEVHSGQDVEVNDCIHAELLMNAGLLPNEVVTDVNAVVIAGEDFRPGLFVILNKTSPLFGIIQNVYHSEGRVFFILKAWITEEFEERYCAYRIVPDANAASVCFTYDNLPHYLAYAHWNPFGKRTKYISVRSILV